MNVWFLGGDNNNNVRKRSVEGDVKQRFTSLDFQQSEKKQTKTVKERERKLKREREVPPFAFTLAADADADAYAYASPSFLSLINYFYSQNPNNRKQK